MPLSESQKQIIKQSTETYRSEITQINTWIYNEADDARCDQLYLLRALSTIEHGERIGLFDETRNDEDLEEIAHEVHLHFHEKDDAELFDDLSILEDDVRERYFAKTAHEKQAILTLLKLSF